MSDVNQKLSDVLGVDYTPVVVDDNDKQMIVHQTDSANPDADYVRSNYYGLIEKGNEALDGILEVAQAAATNINVEKAVFVGSTADLLKKLKNENAV